MACLLGVSFVEVREPRRTAPTYISPPSVLITLLGASRAYVACASYGDAMLFIWYRHRHPLGVVRQWALDLGFLPVALHVPLTLSSKGPVLHCFSPHIATLQEHVKPSERLSPSHHLLRSMFAKDSRR